MELEGQVAIITGGASGFGLGSAKRIIESGAKVSLWDRDGDALSAGTVDGDRRHLPPQGGRDRGPAPDDLARERRRGHPIPAREAREEPTEQWGPVDFTEANAIDVESMGLYWHFVDIVWIVIFTAVYLLEYL